MRKTECLVFLLALVAAVAGVVPFAASAGEMPEGGDFGEWLGRLRAEAAADGISQATLDSALAGISPNKLVIRLDRNQPEFTLSLQTYLGRTISDARVRKGRRLGREIAPLLQDIAARYHVQPRFLLAFYGIETDYGRVTGSFPVIEALATLAHDPRRSEFFRRELLAALHIVDDGHVEARHFFGSWAGAFGGLQFLPSVFRKYAVDYDRDGRIDLASTNGDLFASAANYLSAMGWSDDITWGREVRLPAGFDMKLSGLGVVKPVPEWQTLGVRRVDGGSLPGRRLPASIVIPDKKGGRAFMVYDNFRATMRWNRSLYYAVAVGLLSDRIGAKQGAQ